MLGHNAVRCRVPLEEKEIKGLLVHAKKFKKMSLDDIQDYIGIKNWHQSSEKKWYIREFKKELQNSTNFDFFFNKKTKDIFIKGNKSTDIIPIGEKKLW